jgi:RNA polymerase sporulation-specific sigma factor
MSENCTADAVLTDEALCERAASGDRTAEETLVVRYHRLVRICARPFFLMGGDSEDLIQEGLLGLLKAIREYDPSHSASFKTFAEVCVRNRMISAIKSAARDKHTPLNHSVSIETPLFDESSGYYSMDALDHQADPETLVISREEFQERKQAILSQLSGFEATVLRFYLEGLSCAEIAAQVGRSPKSVDNAVQRVRRKLAQTNPGEFSKR